MRFSRLRDSRFALAVVTAVWLPYMSVCCMAPLEGERLAACCPVMASTHGHGHGQAVTGHDAAHGVAHGASLEEPAPSHAGERSPVHTCCEWTGKRGMTVQKSAQPEAPAVVGLPVPAYELPFDVRCGAASSPVAERGESPPPLYLVQASFLI